MVADETLTAELQALIDARLDTIDRMLLGRVPRADRTAITREVETQIHDLLAERGSGEVDRDLVLSALARLDPPEAYLAEQTAGDPAEIRRPAPPRPISHLQVIPSRAGQVSGVVGLSAIGFDLFAAFLLACGLMSDSEAAVFGFLGLAGLACLLGMVAVGVSLFARVASNWAIIGLTTGLIAMLVSPSAIGFVYFLL